MHSKPNRMLIWFGVYHSELLLFLIESFIFSVLSNPENPPAINFSDFRNKVGNKETVDQLEKAYKALKIVYPKDTLSQEVDQEELDYKKKSESYIEVANAKIAEAKKLVSVQGISSLNNTVCYFRKRNLKWWFLTSTWPWKNLHLLSLIGFHPTRAPRFILIGRKHLVWPRRSKRVSMRQKVHHILFKLPAPVPQILKTAWKMISLLSGINVS